MRSLVILSFILFGCLFKQFNCDTNISEEQNVCTDIMAQNSLDIEQIVGLWYSSEIIPHGKSKDGTYYFKICVTIHIADITDTITTTTQTPRDYFSHTRRTHIDGRRSSNRYLRLLWDEDGKDLKYTLRYNASRPGYWITYGPQEGSLLKTLRYQQFQGSVQVVKAVNNQLVLTFCASNVNGTLFSVILSRQSQSLSSDEIKGIRYLLNRRGLSTTDIRKICTSGSTFNKTAALSIFLLITFLSIINMI